MKNFFEDYIMYVLIIIMVLIVVFAIVVAINNNKQSVNINDTRFTWAIIQLGNGELIAGEVTSWHNFNNSDMIQATIDDNLTVLTHYSNILLFNHEP